MRQSQKYYKQLLNPLFNHFSNILSILLTWIDAAVFTCTQQHPTIKYAYPSTKVNGGLVGGWWRYQVSSMSSMLADV